MGTGLFGSHHDPRTPHAYAKALEVASTFVGLCSLPTAPHDRLVHATRLVMLFLWLDDVADDERLSASDWRSFHAELKLLTDGTPPSRSPGHEEWFAWLATVRDWGARVPGSCAVFLQALAAFFDGLDAERARRGAAVDRETYFAIRRETIFFKVFAEYWRVSLSVDLAPEYEHEVEPLRDLGCDVTIISNDIGSVIRERADEDLNVVFQIARDRSCSSDEAIGVAIDDHNEKIVQYRALRKALESRHSNHHLSTYLEILDVQVTGNLDSMLALVDRYPECAPHIGRLQRIRESG